MTQHGTELKTTQGANAEASTKIKERERVFMEHFNAGAGDRLMKEFYTDDVRFLPPNAPLVQGREEVQGLIQEMQKAYSNVRLEQRETWAAGDLAVTHGAYRADVRTPDGNTVEDRGKYIEVYRNENGTWKCFLDTFTSDLAPGH